MGRRAATRPDGRDLPRLATGPTGLPITPSVDHHGGTLRLMCTFSLYQPCAGMAFLVKAKGQTATVLLSLTSLVLPGRMHSPWARTASVVTSSSRQSAGARRRSVVARVSKYLGEQTDVDAHWSISSRAASGHA